jgi:hypothetical protein
LRWVSPSNIGGCELTGFKMWRDDGSGGAITNTLAFDVANTKFTIEPYVFEHKFELGSAFPGKYVRFKLGAVNREGQT